MIFCEQTRTNHPVYSCKSPFCHQFVLNSTHLSPESERFNPETLTFKINIDPIAETMKRVEVEMKRSLSISLTNKMYIQSMCSAWTYSFFNIWIIFKIHHLTLFEYIESDEPFNAQKLGVNIDDYLQRVQIIPLNIILTLKKND